MEKNLTLEDFKLEMATAKDVTRVAFIAATYVGFLMLENTKLKTQIRNLVAQVEDIQQRLPKPLGINAR
jgi:hypothetical protein